MSLIRVAVYGTTGKVVSFDPSATKGAQIGVNLLMPDGTVATLAKIASSLNITGTNVTSNNSGSIAGQPHRLLSGLALGDDHPQYVLRSILTTRGDLFVEGASGIVRFGIGSNHQFIMSNGTDPVWTTLFANPTAQVGLTAVNGTASTAMRSDAAPALDQSIAPTWTGQHDFTLTPTVASVKVVLESRHVDTGTGLLGGGDLTADRTLSVDDSHFATVALTGAYGDLTGTPTIPPDVSTATFLTENDETGTLPNSRQVLPGNEVTFDDSAPGVRTINLPHVFYGAGPPGISAPLGSLFLANNGTTTNDRAYINTDGASAWTALITAT